MFRDFINKFLFPIINGDNKKLLLFQIGSYPSKDDYKYHEYPVILHKLIEKNYNLDYHIVLIDKEYFCKEKIKEPKIENTIVNGKNINRYIYPFYINNREYVTLIEFCHFINNYSCLSIIMEFTCILRREQFDKNNITDYLYICPSECLTDTKEGLYNPILIDKKFLRLENEDFITPFLIKNNDSFDYCFELLKKRFLNINEFYRKILNYMKIEIPNKIKNNIDIELNYNRKYTHINILYKNLHYRIGIYQDEELFIFIEEFRDKNNEIDDLETYINNKIFNILLDCLRYKNQDDKNKINIEYDNILYNNDIELRKCIEYFSVLFE